MALTRKVGNVWTYRFSYINQFGERKFVERSGFNNERQAKVAGEQHERQFKINKNRLIGEALVYDYFSDYIYRKKQQSVSPRTFANYLNSLRHVKDYFKGKRMSEVTNMDYQMFINNYAQEHSKETVKKIHSHLGACFRYAHKNGHIPSDPSYDIHLWGNVEPKHKHLKYLSKSETSKLISELENGINPTMKSRYLLLLLLATGMRVGEGMALKKDDFDFNKNTISINKSYDYIILKKEVPTKNNSSNRIIAIDAGTMNTIKSFIDYHQPDNYIFNNENEPITHNAISKTLKKACRRAGITAITPHGLRHTHASLLIANNLDIFYISERLGHSSVHMTQKVYAHVIEELKNFNNGELNDLMESLR